MDRRTRPVQLIRGHCTSFGIRRGRASRRIGSHATIVNGSRWQVLLTAISRSTDGGGLPVGYRGLLRSIGCDHSERRAVNHDAAPDSLGGTHVAVRHR